MLLTPLTLLTHSPGLSNMLCLCTQTLKTRTPDYLRGQTSALTLESQMASVKSLHLPVPLLPHL